MAVFRKIFSKNPFRSLKQHMEKTKECVHKVDTLFVALFAGDKDKVFSLAKHSSH